MKWYRSKERLNEILELNKNELEKYKSDKIIALLKDESNLIQDHLELLYENEKLKESLEKLETDNHSCYLDYCELQAENSELKKAIEILKGKLKLSLNDNKAFKTINAVLPIGNNDINRLTQQEYYLLKEVLGNE